MFTRALLDNSSFAGVMRCYAPQLENHQRFIQRYPEHHAVDQASLADFITAICLYDHILLESSSRAIDPKSGTTTESEATFWVDSLKTLLPTDISSLVFRSDLSATDMTEDQFITRSYDILTSPMNENLLSKPIPKLPTVYSAKDYFYRPYFERVNANHGDKLNEKELEFAMFLHRGLLLQAVASKNKSVYLPYQYRAQLLSKLPPMAWRQVETLGDAPSLPFAHSTHYQDSDYLRSLNTFYYDLIKKVTWTEYSPDIPFIGNAVLTRAKGNVREAFRLAIEIREEGRLKNIIEKLNSLIQDSDRPQFESALEGYKQELGAAAEHFGLTVDNTKQQSFYKLAVSWLPSHAKEAVDAALTILPQGIKFWGKKVSSQLITETPLQMLFVEHVEALRARS